MAINMEKLLANTQEYDTAKHLKTEEDMAEYLAVCLEDNDPQMTAHALGVIARAKGMTALARDTGLSREQLYKSLSPSGNPELATVMKVLNALGYRLTATRAAPLPAITTKSRRVKQTKSTRQANKAKQQVK